MPKSRIFIRPVSAPLRLEIEVGVANDFTAPNKDVLSLDKLIFY